MLKKARRVRHALRRSKRTPTAKQARSGYSTTTTASPASPASPPSPAITIIIAACNAAATGFDVCARKTRNEAIAVAATRESASLRSVAEEMIAAAAEAHGVDARPRARTCDRLRWEWLASTGMVVDGRPDMRLLSECARILEELPLAATSSSALGANASARLRVAAMTAASLAMSGWETIAHRDSQLAYALG